VPRPERRAARLAFVVIVSGLTGAAAAPAQEPAPSGSQPTEAWFGEIRTEPSDVVINGRDTTWWTNRLELDWRRVSSPTSTDAVWAAGSVQTRGSDTEGAGILGADRRRGDWFYSAELAASPDPTFLPKVAVQGQVGRLFHYTLVSLQYRFLDFAATNVHLGTLSVTQNFPWGEVEGRVALGENVAEDGPIRVGVVRALWLTSERLRLGGGAAFGTRLFDVIAVETADKEGWTVFANAAWQLDPRNAVRVDWSYSREGDGFRQIGGALSYRRSF
jgi:YaiO family outer membrane protein